MKFATIFLLLFHSQVVLSVPLIDSLRPKRQACTGETKTEFQYCDDEEASLRYTFSLIEVRIHIVQACDGLPSINWVLMKDGNAKPYDSSFYINKSVFVIAPSDNLIDGMYTLTVKVQEKGLKAVINTCKLELMSEPPVPVFVNGRVHSERMGASYTVDLTPSISKVPLKPEDINWADNVCKFSSKESCEDSECPPQPTDFKMFVPGDPCMFSIEVKASFEFHEMKVFAKQIIHFIPPNKSIVKFRCKRNCDMEQNKLTNPSQDTYLELTCVDACANFNKFEHEYEVADVNNRSNIIPRSKYEVKNNVDVLIKRNTFQNDVLYKLSMKTKDNAGLYTAMTYFKTSPKIKGPHCFISPDKGKSMQTVFKVTCEPTELYGIYYPPDYNVYQVLTDGTEQLVASSSYRVFDFVLGSTGQPKETLYVSGHDLFYNKYRNSLGSIKLEQQKINENHAEVLAGFVEEASNKGDYARAVQITTGMLLEVERDSSVNKGTLFKNVLKSLQNIAVESIYSYNRIGSLLKTFYKTDNPEYKNELSTLCKQLSQTQLSALKRGLYNVQMDDEAKALLNPLKECANKLLEAETIELDEINVTEPPELVKDPALIEEYANYDQAFYNQEEELVKNNAIETVLNSALATALTINPGDEVEEAHNKTRTKVSKEFGKDLHKIQISLDGVNVSMSSEDAKLADKKITTIVTRYNKDLFKTDLHSNIVDVGVFDMKESTKKTANVRVNITFDLENAPIPKDKYTAKAPGSRSAWKDPDIEYTMNVHRIDLPKQQVCSAEFKKLDAGQKLQVVFMQNRRPKLEDFTKSNIHIVDAAFAVSSIIACPFKQHEFDTFIYMAVLPPDQLATSSSGNISIDYEVVFASQYCLTYQRNLRSWETADCDITFIPNATKSKLMCSCSHTSLFAAKNAKVESKLDLIQKIEYETHLYINYVIFIHVAVVFACYCIALIFVFKRVPKSLGREKVIFLSDNLKNDRYAYILIVTTGDYANAGTTANVMVQIFAEKANSKPHVLNYPDPDKKLLQRNSVDWFILTNDLYLGDILYIELWFDGIGYRPSWFCENIYLVDLQNRKEWYFNVQKLFTLRDDVSTEYKIEPNDTFVVDENVMDTIIKHSKFHVGAELTWNIFSKTNDNSFLYSQRLTVILSMIYTTYVLVIWFMYPPIMRMADAYAYGYFQFTNEVLVIPPITSILSCLINLPFVYFFRNSENETNFFAFFKEKKAYSMMATKITWVLLVSWITLCMLYLVIFGYFVTIHTAYFWIFATILSIIIGIFIVENLYITILTIIQARLAKFKISHYDFVGMLKEIENQRKILFSVFGEMLLRPYFLQHYKHLTREKILEMMQMEIRRSEVARLCKDFLVFLVYLGLLYAICFAHVDPQDYQSNRAMRRMLRGGFFTVRRSTRKLDQLFTIKDVYDYINYTVIPLIHATNWYGNYHSKDAGQMLDFNTKILGVAQLRQQRREQNCYPAYPMNLLDIKCDNISKIFKSWEFNNGSEIAYSLGVLDNYGGEGYIANMGRTLYNSYFMLNLLNKLHWIDINTKVLFIDFWTYNPNHNIFNLVKITIERSPTGHYAKSYSVFTTRLLYSSTLKEAIVILLIIAFILVLMYNTFISIVNIIKVKGKFFNQGWEVIDAILVILSIAVCTLYFYRRNVIKTIMERLVNTDHNKFVNYFGIIKIAKANTWISSALVCLATLRLWKFLRFAIIFRALERTLWKASSALLMTLLYQAFIYFNFTFYINMMYGPTYHLFQSYRKTFTTLFLISINFFDDFDHTYLSQYGAEIYILYTLFVLSSLVFLTIYSTIIILGLEESQIFYSNRPEYYSLKNYWIDQGTYYSEILKRHNKNTRLRAGQDEEEEEPDMVYPKEVAKRYVDCLSMTNDKMLLMRFVALAVIRKRSGIKENLKRKRLTENQFNLMARIVVCLSKAKRSKQEQDLSNSHLFFHGKDPVDNSIRFVSNDTILRIEFAAKYMLERRPPDIIYEKDRYIIHVDGDTKRLAYYREVLEIINKSIENIRIVSISKRRRMEDAAKAGKGGKFGGKKQKKKGKDEKKESMSEKKMDESEKKTVRSENKKGTGEKKTVKGERKVKKRRKSEEEDESL